MRLLPFSIFGTQMVQYLVIGFCLGLIYVYWINTVKFERELQKRQRHSEMPQCKARDGYNSEALKMESSNDNESFLNTKLIFNEIISCKQVKLLSYDEPRQSPFNNSQGQLFKVPNIVHRIKFSNKKEFSFQTYLSYLSVEKFLKPDYVFVHGDTIPSGKWWNKTIKEVPNIYFIYQRQPNTIGGVEIKIIQHCADILRLNLMKDYGGIYLDDDVLILKSFDPLRLFDFTLGREIPSSLAVGIMVSSRSAKLPEIWLETYHYFKHKSWGANSVEMAAKLANIFPHLVHVESKSMFQPNWEHDAYMYGSLPYDWSDNYSVHFYQKQRAKNFPKDPEKLKGYNCTAGEVMRFVYYGSHELLSNNTFHD